MDIFQLLQSHCLWPLLQCQISSLFLTEAELKIKQVGNKFATGVENKATKGGYKT